MTELADIKAEHGVFAAAFVASIEMAGHGATCRQCAVALFSRGQRGTFCRTAVESSDVITEALSYLPRPLADRLQAQSAETTAAVVGDLTHRL